MAKRFTIRDEDFDAQFRAFLHHDRNDGEDVSAVVRTILDAVRADGFAAVAEMTNKFDNFDVTPETARVSDDDIKAATAQCDEDALAALRFAADRVRAYHEMQLPADVSYTDGAGVQTRLAFIQVSMPQAFTPPAGVQPIRQALS